jgi:Zn-dependent protease/CBS domain-containing protein
MMPAEADAGWNLIYDAPLGLPAASKKGLKNMTWSFSLGRIAGTEVRVHFTFLLLVAWYGIAAGLRSGSSAALEAVLFILAVFACVVLHEYGHVLAARRYGIETRDITLLPIGGVANIQRMPDRPGQELVIAIAGPLVNVVIAIILIALFRVNFTPERLADIEQGRLDFVTRLASVNIALVIFNLLPAFPMDGGRVLRALLAMRLGRIRATRVAATIGQVVAFGLGFLGLFGSPLLIFIAIFVFIAATSERQLVEMSEVTRGVPMMDATITSLQSLDTQATVAQAVRALLATTQTEFPVVDGAGHLRGVLTRDGIIRALSETGPTTPVIDVMEREVPVVSRRAPLSQAIEKLQTGNNKIVGVVDEDNRIVGILTMENLAEFMLVQRASEAHATKIRPVVAPRA